MPTENKPVEHSFDLNTPDGGRGYIANLFKTVLKRHDYRQYIAERLAGDFACTMAQHLERITAERDALQQRLNAADQLNDTATSLIRRMVANFDTEIRYHEDVEPNDLEHDLVLSEMREFLNPKDDDWHMNPCKQGHRDVGAAGGVAACNQCDEKIEAATTQEAFERWNATHLPSPVAVVMPDRSPEDYAIEHAEYMAKSADDVLAKFQAYGLALLAIDEGGDDGEGELFEAIDSARQDLQESLVDMRGSVYEFRKRSAKSR
jgi:hypothetical protein